MIDDDAPREGHDFSLSDLARQDLYDLSVDDLDARIAALHAEIARCEAAKGARADTLSAAEKLFKS